MIEADKWPYEGKIDEHWELPQSYSDVGNVKISNVARIEGDAVVIIAPD